MLLKENDGSVNFIDENDVFVGYGLEQDCCEYAGWIISESDVITEDVICSEIDSDSQAKVNGFVFDTGYFIEQENIGDFGDYFNVATFRIVKDDKELFIHLFNMHNGYYGHGFASQIGVEEWKYGDL